MITRSLCTGFAAAALFAAGSNAQIDSFRPLSSYGVPNGIAEIVAASGDGNTLVYTNADGFIGLVDITDPQNPVGLPDIAVSGEPTSVAVIGRWAVATVWVSTPEEGAPPPNTNDPGQLVVIDISVPAAARVIGIVPVGFHPDSVKATLVGDRAVAVIAVENEPIIVENGLVTGDDLPGDPRDVSPPGLIQVVTLRFDRPATSPVVDVPLPQAVLQSAGLLFSDDPQPEFVDIKGTTAVVSLQENNGMAIVDIADPSNPVLRRVFSTGVVAGRRADLTSDEDTRFTETYPDDVDGQKHPISVDGGGRPVTPGVRMPDAIAFSPDGSIIYGADEGELDYTGGRGFSAWTPGGALVWDTGDELEAIAIGVSHYPEGRSDAKGVECEGVTTARFGARDYAFVLSERGSFCAIYDITRPSRPAFTQILPTGISPEGVVAIPSRDLVVTSDEGSGTLTFFVHQQGPYAPSVSKPTLFSIGTVQPWAAISGLTAGREGVLYGVPDNAMPTRIYRIQTGAPLARVVPFLPVRKGLTQANYDGEGIVDDRTIVAPTNAGWWLASEGDASSNPNLLVQVDRFGQVVREIQLPNSIDPAADASLSGAATSPAGGEKIRSNGFEGVAVSTDGRYLYAAIQREFNGEFPGAVKYTRIARYALRQLQGTGAPCNGMRCGGDWDFFYYPLDAAASGNWIGLSEIITIGDDQLLVIERDNAIGTSSVQKKLYAFSLRAMTPDQNGVPDATDTVVKAEAMDVLSAFFPYEKVEGLALTRSGHLWIGLDNDGGEVESRLIDTGRFSNPLN